MPQTTELPLFKAGYPIYAPAQKPGGVTISTTLWARAVPNKPQWTGTQVDGADLASVGSPEYNAELEAGAGVQGAMAPLSAGVEGVAPAGARMAMAPTQAPVKTEEEMRQDDNGGPAEEEDDEPEPPKSTRRRR